MKKITLSLLFFAFCIILPLQAQRHIEKLDRGLVAMKSSNQIFLSWRVLGSDPDNVAFNLYRDGVKINSEPITTASNYTDNTTSATTYTVKTVINGAETGEQKSASVWSNNYMEISLSVPASMTMPDGSSCTYSPNDCSVGDADGDGELEIVVKWDPSNSKDNSQSGYTGNVYLDTYKLDGTLLSRIDLGRNIRAGAHYTDFEVEDFDGDGKAEIICKTAPGTKDGLGNYLSKGPAASDNDAADYRTTNGYILTGPEYLSCFSALTGAELSTVNYTPARGTVSSWGDSYGNRVDRFLACSPYLDGVHPSAVMCRGYYTRAVLAAWDFRNGQLTQRWVYDSNSPNGANARGQGNHNLSVGDVDNDGKDEVVWGSAAFDDDGRCMYSTGLGHGDAIHMSDLDPERKGLEVWEVHESTGAAYGEEMHDAKTGEILWGNFTGTDNGRSCAANVIPGNRGFEMWSASVSAIRNDQGATVSSSKASMNFRIYWDGDLEDELLDGTTISKFNVGPLLTATGCLSNNSTKATPNLSADILGDWREELVLRTSDNSKLRIYSTNIPTPYKMYTLMHDAQYRNAIAWQNTGYNQPPHAGFYIGNDMDTPPVSAIYNNEMRWKSGTIWDINSTASWADSLDNTSTFKNGEAVLFDITAGADANVTINGDLSPKRMKVNSPYNVTIAGTGTLTGDMDLKKIGAGSLKLMNNNSFTGTTTIWDGDFYNSGNLSNSEVFIQPFVGLAGTGTFGKNVTMSNLTTVAPGNALSEVATLTFNGNLTERGATTYTFDVSINSGAVAGNDKLIIGGNWTLSEKSTFVINTVNGTIPAGDIVLATCTGTVTGDITKITVEGVPSELSYLLVVENSNIILRIKIPTTLTWSGSVDTKWDNGNTANWLQNSTSKIFLSNDEVLFNDDAVLKSVVINESVLPASIVVNNESNYSFSGSGSIDGETGLTKNGSGKIIITNANKYTGQTIINDGTIEIPSISNGGEASPVGAATSAPINIQLNGGKLSYTGATTSTDRGMTVNSKGGSISVTSTSAELSVSGNIIGSGRLTKEGSGRLKFTTSNIYNGGTVIKSGSISLGSDEANISGMGTDSIIFEGGSLFMYDSNTTDNTSNWNILVPAKKSGTLNVDGRSTISGSISGEGTLNYFTAYTGNVLASDMSGFGGTMNVLTDADGGNMVLFSSKGYEAAKLNLYNKVTMLYRATSNITIPIGDLTGMSASNLGAGGMGACKITWEIGARNANSTFSGVISNTQYSGTGAVAAISKVGTGTWTLTNANTFAGGTVINDGTIMVRNTTGSGLGTSSVTVNANGTLAGNGSIDGELSVADGGTFAPGYGVGTFTVKNNVSIQNGGILSVEIDKTTSKNDLLTSTGTVNMAGKLQVTAVSTTIFAAGDAFKIINGTVVGAPTEIIPATPGEGLEWDLSEFVSNGTLKVNTMAGLRTNTVSSDIYPNPFNDVLNIKLAETLNNANLRIVNLLGETIYSSIYNNTDNINLSLGQLQNGIYLLQIKEGNKLISKKIIKE